MGNERMKSLHQINSLNPKKDKEFTLIKSQLQQIYYVLKTPTLDRVFRLSGLNPPINSLLLKSNTGKICGFLENVFHLMRLDPFFKSQTKKYNEFLSIVSPFLLGEKVLGPAIRRITTDEHLTQSPTLIVGGANELENAESHSLSGVPHNVQAGAVKDSTFNAKDPISYAQHEIHLASFPVDKRSSNTPTSISHQKYLPETVPAMSPSQEGSLLLPNGKGIPSGNSQIQSSRTALSAEDEKNLVYQVLSTIWYHMIKCFPGSQLTLGFTTNAETFRHAEFLKQADSLSLALLDAPEIEHMNIIDNTPIAQLVRSLVNNFRTPDRRAVQIRIQFQMIFYILEFLDQYYKPIVRKVLVWPNNYSDLQKELKFMGSYLKFFRNRDQYPSSMYENPDMYFLTASVQLDVWIAEVFKNNNWLEIRGEAPKTKFNTWMGKIKGPIFAFS
ncbi:hypothetical protein PGT21_002796 [Puccinia graminis f. sp. tritici]|uniref:Uncharacterized protein n=1 Tax=Puccinia graminis f. sp. tritici TaxID=56615 RepID=A0A5B0N4T5_PUCGR|nr:hypothetical protein PGT21_002796 [Puccinia graminis f. sp. tritici]